MYKCLVLQLSAFGRQRGGWFSVAGLLAAMAVLFQTEIVVRDLNRCFVEQRAEPKFLRQPTSHGEAGQGPVGRVSGLSQN